MPRGYNKAVPFDKLVADIGNLLFEMYQLPEKPCVFISHKREDTKDCEKIAEYLMDANVNVYFDKYDDSLSRYASEEDADKLTETIRKGIDESTHMLCVVSEMTYKSYWVPFEVGYGYCRIKLGILTLKDMAEADLPDYMKTSDVIIRGTKSLNDFIAQLLGQKRDILESQGIIKKSSVESHPLDKILNWQK